MKMCFFCRQPIEGKAERHHVIPKRYFKGGNHRHNNIAWAHSECHRLWHTRHDNPSLSKSSYLKLFKPIRLGEGVFNGD